jgi:hypothetical protein
MRDIEQFDTYEEYEAFITEKRIESKIRHIVVAFDDVHKCIDCTKGDFKCEGCEHWEPWIVDMDDFIVWQSESKENALEVALFLSTHYRCTECHGLFLLPADFKSSQKVPAFCNHCLEGND